MSKRLNNIDFLKIVFNLGIIYGHILQHYLIPQFKEYKTLFNYTSYSYGYMCEFLFIISGYFLFKELNKNDTRIFVVKKIQRLWPIFAFSIIITYILSRFSLSKWTDVNAIPELLFLNRTVIYNMPVVTGVGWYVGALFWSSIFYFIISKIFEKKSIYIIYLITFFSYMILFSKVYLYSEPKVFNSFMTFYMIRGLAGVGLGILFAYNLRINTTSNIDVKSVIIGILEVTIFILIILYLSIIKIKFTFPVGFSLFVILFYLFIKGDGLFSILLNRDKIIIPFISKYIYGIYIMQFIVFGICDKFLYKNDYLGVIKFPILNIIVTILLCFIVGILSHVVVDKIVYYVCSRLEHT